MPFRNAIAKENKTVVYLSQRELHAWLCLITPGFRRYCLAIFVSEGRHMRQFCRIRVPGSRLSHTSVSVHFILALKKSLADQTKRVFLALMVSS
jgi:hypothetical protein